MLELVLPDVRYRDSWLESLAEWGEGLHQDGAAITETLDPHDPESFAAWVDYLRRDEDEDNPRPDGFVPSTNRWIIEGDSYLGAIQLRHRLTPFLHEMGGHIGYGVRPSARRRGLARFALAGMLERARRLGLDRVLITCDEDNVGSRRTIEGAGGVYEDSRQGKRRYWIDLD